MASGLTDFEKERNARIAANRLRLQAIGLAEMINEMQKSNAAFATANRGGGGHKPRASNPSVPRRTSNRVQVRKNPLPAPCARQVLATHVGTAALGAPAAGTPKRTA